MKLNVLQMVRPCTSRVPSWPGKHREHIGAAITLPAAANWWTFEMREVTVLMLVQSTRYVMQAMDLSSLWVSN